MTATLDRSADVVTEGARPPKRFPWERRAVLLLLAATAALYLWNLSVSGWANPFYSAAVQAGTKSWKAFFFGSSDASNFITVDKPPASLWLMELSARLFGVNSFAILLPQALEGVAAVGVLYAAVRRTSGHAAGLIAGAVLALTPVAALMFRFNNPDALLVLLMTLGAYGVVRAVTSVDSTRAQTRWLALAGACIGFAFLTKTLQAFLVLPAFALVYLVAAPTTIWRRLRQIGVATLAMVVAGGWWVAVVELIPAADRPYIGGSQDNDFLSLTFGYNGFGRLTGDETGSVGGGGGGGWGATGWTRMFGSEVGSQISWLLPTALLLLGFGLWATRRARRTDPERAALLLWGGWLLLTGAVFSYMAGIFHPYYTVALAPAIGAVVGIGAMMLWRRRANGKAAVALGTAIAVGAVWAFVLLNRTPEYLPWLRYVVLIGGLASAGIVALAARAPKTVVRWAGVAGLVALLLGPAVYTLDTVNTAHTGAIPSAGPAAAGGFGGPGGAGRGAPGGGNFGGFPGGQGQGQGQLPSQSQVPSQGSPFGQGGTSQGGTSQGGFGGGTAGGGGAAGGMGGLLNGSTVSSALTQLLQANAGKYTWVAATIGSNNAASYQLASGDPVMAIGGFNGTDPTPTLAQFEQYVQQGKIHYYISGSTGGSSSSAAQIASWVKSHFTAQTVGGVTVYDLTAATSTSTA
ncbi:MAG TPA: glycosyltransferase family 39 protein [Actinocrinis sp.]|nr:glycosyltransferase family 39 protein [Actinocrinis sp.]